MTKNKKKKLPDTNFRYKKKILFSLFSLSFIRSKIKRGSKVLTWKEHRTETLGSQYLPRVACEPTVHRCPSLLSSWCLDVTDRSNIIFMKYF